MSQQIYMDFLKKKRICCKNFYFERTNQPFFKAVLLFTKLVT